MAVMNWGEESPKSKDQTDDYSTCQNTELTDLS